MLLCRQGAAGAGILKRATAAAARALSAQPVADPLSDLGLAPVAAAAAPRGAATTAAPRNDWTKDEIAEIYHQPFTELLYEAATVHRANFDPLEVQKCTLLSIKTGGCTEDCKYCAQSVRYKTGLKPTPQMLVDDVVAAAKRAKAAGSTRFCMGTAWRELGKKKNAFGKILEMVREVNGLGLEVCTTLGMVNAEQAKQLKEAGLSAYNHNLDTSREHYPKVITTRTYDDRLETIKNVREAGLSVCCGGILGIGEKVEDRIGLLHELGTMVEHPESVPINSLVPIDGTPLEGSEPPSIFDIGRTIAAARIVMPRTMVRLSAGRLQMSELDQTMMFMAGANSIFTGDKLLTTANPEMDKDEALFDKLGMTGRPAFAGNRKLEVDAAVAAGAGVQDKAGYVSSFAEPAEPEAEPLRRATA